MNEITERIEELKRNVLFNENELKEYECSPKENIPYKAILAVRIYGQKVEILELELYLLSVITSVEEELKTLDRYYDGTFYKVEDIKNILKKLKLQGTES